MIILDGHQMLDRKALHTHLKERFNLSEHYGENLDALWDELSERTEPMEIVFYNADECVDELGEYGLSMLALLKELDQKNESVRLRFEG